MRRVAPLLGGIAAVGVVLPMFIGVGPRTFLFVLPLFAALGVVALVGSRRAAVVEHGWSGAAGTGNVLAPGPLTAERRSRQRPPAARVAAALARVEAREMATSPWFGVGLGLLAMSFLMLAVVYAGDNGAQWAEVVDLAPWLAHPLVGMVVVAAHRGITRAQRDGADELFDTCPVAPTTRTWGALGAAWVPVLTLVVFAAVFGSTVAVRSPHLYGSPGEDAVPKLLGAYFLGVGGVVLGVALGRWVHFALAPVVAVVAIGFVSTGIATFGDPDWNPLQQLSMSPPATSGSPIFVDPHAWSHLAWLGALTATVLVVALARHRRDRTMAVCAVAACVLLAVTGAAATRPMSGSSAARIAGVVASPAEHQACRSVRSIQVCAYAGHDELLGRVVTDITPVAARLPDGVSGVTLRQSYPGRIDELPPEVRRRLPGGVPAVPAGEISLGFNMAVGELWVSRFHVGLHALGLPTEPDPELRPMVIAGQARGAVVLWLAAQGLGPDETREIISGTSASDLGNREPDMFDRGYAWPAGCDSAPVVWSAQDLRAARALAALPEPTVRSVVHQEWERWLDPTTGTDELLAAAGLPPAGPFDDVQTRRVDPC